MIEISSDLINYAERKTSPEPKLLQELKEYCYQNYSNSSMLSGFYQGRFLSTLSRLIAPRRILEIGTYLGYSALCLAEGLTEDGKLYTLDINAETNRVAKSFVERSALKNKIEFRLGNALEIIPELAETFDLVFIDADKVNYSNYFDAVIDKVRPGGLILADNVLWSGKVLSPSDDDSISLDNFNKKIQADGRVSNLLLTIRDGLMLCIKN
ncbi:MAG TPA: class I SAM-dependent methyltransferase [Pyrinomonadaceae bacterium]|nr:class I SAM-dependent methyltransferase [Pyrinomonadaceae bacterium]